MKKIVIMLLSAMLCMSMVSCSGTDSTAPVTTPEAQTETAVGEDTGNEEVDPVIEKKYSSALSLIEVGSYEDAYLVLKECGDYKDSEELLGNFKFVYGTKTTPMDGGEFVTDTYTYDERGNCIREATDRYGTYTEWTYDESGKLLSEETCDSFRIMNHSYFYNEDGTVTKEVENRYSNPCIETYDSEMKRIKHKCFDDDSGIDTIDYFYDENGNLIETVQISIDGTPFYEKYEYDEYSNMTRHVSITETGKEYFCGEYVHTLDDEGKVTQTQVYNNGNYYHTLRYTYDEYGNLLKEEMFAEIEGESDNNYVVVTEYSDYLLFYLG